MEAEYDHCLIIIIIIITTIIVVVHHLPFLCKTHPLCTLMLFLNWYPGVDDPFLSSSLKMTICSKRKTRLSLERDKTPASCSVTKKVSCCSSLP